MTAENFKVNDYYDYVERNSDEGFQDDKPHDVDNVIIMPRYVLYLPPELSIKEMYDAYINKNNAQCSYMAYINLVHGMNISFAKLGEEQCDICMEFQLHSHSTPHEENNYKNNENGDYFENSADEWACNLLKESSIRFQHDCDM